MPKRVRTVMKTNVYSTAQLDFLPKTLMLREVQQRNEPIKTVFINPVYKPKMMLRQLMVKRSILNVEKLQKVNFTINYRFISKNGDSESNVKRT